MLNTVNTNKNVIKSKEGDRNKHSPGFLPRCPLHAWTGLEKPRTPGFSHCQPLSPHPQSLLHTPTSACLTLLALCSWLFRLLLLLLLLLVLLEKTMTGILLQLLLFLLQLSVPLLLIG
jgi:hypothetical protein